MGYIDHILTLDFQPIIFTSTEKHSHSNACHWNCDNYIAENGGEHILGWLRIPWGNGFRYLRHSCVHKDGVTLDITQRWLLHEAHFAADPRMQINTNVTDSYSFLDAQGHELIQAYYDVT